MPPARLNATGPDRGKALDTIPVPPEIPEGLPSDLLNRRPDIQEAEQGLRATQARVAAARTAWFPSIALTGALGGESLAFADLFKGSALAWNFAGSLAAPLFNGGLTAAQIDLASANERAAAAQYRDSVIRAFADLRSAFVAKRQAATRTVALEQAVRALRRQQRLATLRYDNGFSSYLEVLDAERALFDSELALVDARRAHLVAGVDLYRALGGGWTPE
jgi:multidrug efflux system outer membrane protein